MDMPATNGMFNTRHANSDCGIGVDKIFPESAEQQKLHEGDNAFIAPASRVSASENVDELWTKKGLIMARGIGEWLLIDVF